MNYNYECPDCGGSFNHSTTGMYAVGDEIECPKCGRISKITELDVHLLLIQTNKTASPTQYEELERIKKEIRERESF